MDNRLGGMEKLRDEILQAESTRSDLLKWKLGLVGAIGAAGLGFAGSVELRHADLVLCALPPVAVYVDLLALHLTLRILVIGAFLRMAGAAEAPAYRSYEEFAYEARSAFELEDWALSYSTYALCAGVAGYGVYQLVAAGPTFGILFVLSGTIGAIGEFIGRQQYARRCRAVAALKPPMPADGA